MIESTDPSTQRRSQYLLELLQSTLAAIERITRRLEQEDREERETLRLVLREL